MPNHPDGLGRLGRIMASELSPYLLLLEIATLLERRPEGFRKEVERLLDEVATDDFDHGPPPLQVMVALARGAIAEDAAKTYRFFMHAYALAMGIRDNPAYGTLYVEAAVALATHVGLTPPSGVTWSAADDFLNEAASYIESNVAGLGKSVPTLRLCIQDARNYIHTARLLEPGPDSD